MYHGAVSISTQSVARSMLHVMCYMFQVLNFNYHWQDHWAALGLLEKIFPNVVADLLTENRLYRQTAGHTGDTAVSNVLDELDRVLLEIAHGPSRLSPGDLDEFRQRLKAEGILFKIRVLGSNVRNQEAGPEISAPLTAPKI